MKVLRYFKSLILQIKKDRAVFIVYLVLNAMVAAVFVRTVFQQNYESSFICLLAFLLFLIPPFVETTFHVRLPNALEITALVFVFAAEILGEIECFYVKVPLWDTLLHTVNGFMFAAFGFCIVEMLNRHSQRFKLSPIFCALVAFCLSMTIGVLWEFYEFASDVFFDTDMQKDYFIRNLHSVSFAEPGSNTAVSYNGIVSTTVLLESGETLTFDGYLDVGVIDTMKDLFVNFIGATVFSVIGYFHVRYEGKSRFAKQFIPEVIHIENTDACVADKDANENERTKNEDSANGEKKVGASSHITE